MKTWYVYLLECDQRLHYVGITDDLARRRLPHESKESKFTSQFHTLELVYVERYSSKQAAAKRERQLKGWSQKKKQLLKEGQLGINACTELAKALWVGREVYPERS